MRNQQKVLLVIVPLLIFCAAVGIRGVSDEAFWNHEIWSIQYAGGAQYGPVSLVETVQRVIDASDHERNPPLYYLILNAWMQFTGSSEFSVRVLSVLAGLVAVAWIFRAGRDFAGTMTAESFVIAIGAAITLGASAYFIQYMQDARAYIFVVLFIGMDLALYWRIVRARSAPSLAVQIALMLGIGAVLWMHFTALVVFLAIGLYHLLFERRSPQFWRVIILAALSGVPLLLWTPLLFLAVQSAYDAFHLNPLPPMVILHDLTIAFSNDAIALFVLLLVLSLTVRKRYTFAIWFITLVSLVAALVLNAKIGFVTVVRYVIFMFPLMALLMGIGVSVMARSRAAVVSLLALWIVAGTLTSIDFSQTRIPYDVHNNWLEMVAAMKPHIQPDDLILFHAANLGVQHILELDHYMYPFPNRHSLTEDIPGILENNQYYTQAVNFVGNAPRVWLGIDQSGVWLGVDQTAASNLRLAEMRRALSANYTLCYTAVNTESTRLDLYAHNVSHATAAHFGDGIDIALDEPLSPNVQTTLSVLLEIHLSDAVPRDAYSVGLHIDDANGTFKTNQDFGLSDSTETCERKDIDVSALPAGTYSLYVVVYDWRTLARLPVSALTGTPADNRVLVGKFTITPKV